MSLWIQFFAVNEKGRKTKLGDRWTSQHKAHTHADVEAAQGNSDYQVEVDLEQLPKGTKKVLIDFCP